MTNEKRNDEIDLIEVFLNIYIFFKKHFWTFVLSLVIGGILGYSTKFFATKHYESTMIINSYTVSEDILIENFNNINSIIKDGNYSYLSERLELDSTLLITLNDISAEQAYDEKLKKDKDYVYVHVKLSDNKILKDLSNGLLTYFEKEPYIKSEIETYEENNMSLIAKIDEEINKLDKLQDNLLNPVQSKSDVNIYNDQKSFQNEILGLVKEKQTREKYLKYSTPFRIIQDFTVFNKPIKKVKTYTIIGAFLGFFFILMFLVIRNINKTINKN